MVSPPDSQTGSERDEAAPQGARSQGGMGRHAADREADHRPGKGQGRQGLPAFIRLLEASAQDDVLDPFDLIVTRMFVDTVRKGREARLCILRDFGAAALTLSKVCTLVLDGAVADGDLRILKENLLWVQTFETIEDLRQALLAFRKIYNTTWPIKHHGFLMPARFSPEAASNRRHR